MRTYDDIFSGTKVYPAKVSLKPLRRRIDCFSSEKTYSPIADRYYVPQ
jgi:hypothetical protein